MFVLTLFVVVNLGVNFYREEYKFKFNILLD